MTEQRGDAAKPPVAGRPSIPREVGSRVDPSLLVAPGSGGRGQILPAPLVVVFAPSGWDPASDVHLAAYNRVATIVAGPDARIVRVRGHGAWHEADFENSAPPVPMLLASTSDLAAHFGIGRGPAVFVVDAGHVVRWRYLDGEALPSPDALAGALADLATQGSRTESPTRERDDDPSAAFWTRRGFLAAALGAGVALALAPVERAVAGAPREGAARPLAPVVLHLNGRDVSLELEPRVTLLDALREHAGLTGTKKGCDHGQCGACTVHVDRRRVLSCLSLAAMQQGKSITTIEGLAATAEGGGDALHPMQQAFLTHDGFQCGYCTPGQIMSACAVVREPWGPDDAAVREAMSGNICRCGAYPNIVAAVQEVRRSQPTVGGAE